MNGSGNTTTLLFPLAIILGLVTGHFLPTAGETLDAFIDPLVLGLLALLFSRSVSLPFAKPHATLAFYRLLG